MDQTQNRGRSGAKGVKAILYDRGKDGKHKMLHNTLTAWASIWGGGMSARRNRVNELGKMAPEALTEEAHSEFIYAVSSPSTAAYLAEGEAGMEVDIGWIDVLDRYSGT